MKYFFSLKIPHIHSNPYLINLILSQTSHMIPRCCSVSPDFAKILILAAFFLVQSSSFLKRLFFYFSQDKTQVQIPQLINIPCCKLWNLDYITCLLLIFPPLLRLVPDYSHFTLHTYFYSNQAKTWHTKLTTQNTAGYSHK